MKKRFVSIFLFTRSVHSMLKLKKLHQVEIFFLAVVAFFAFDIGDLKYAFALLFVVVIIFQNVWVKERAIVINAVTKKIMNIVWCLIFLFLITIVLQLINGYNSYAFNEAIYYFTPIAIIFVYSQIATSESIDNVMNWMFVIYVVNFLYDTAGNLTVANIMSISFSDSYSPFESGYSFIFILFECYYLKKGRTGLAAVSFFINFLAFKRLAVVMGIFFFVFRKVIFNDKKISDLTFYATVAIFVLIPVVTVYAVENDFDEWFYGVFGEDIDELTLLRYSRLEMTIASDEIKYGMGSVVTFMTEKLNDLNETSLDSRSLHNDLVQMYLECGIFGSIAWTYSYFKFARVSRSTFAIMVYVFTESIVNHPFGAGSVPVWIVIYFYIAYFIMEEERKEKTAKSEEPAEEPVIESEENEVVGKVKKLE